MPPSTSETPDRLFSEGRIVRTVGQNGRPFQALSRKVAVAVVLPDPKDF
jgi:hypothetical protein